MKVQANWCILHAHSPIYILFADFFSFSEIFADVVAALENASDDRLVIIIVASLNKVMMFASALWFFLERDNSCLKNITCINLLLCICILCNNSPYVGNCCFRKARTSESLLKYILETASTICLTGIETSLDIVIDSALTCMNAILYA